MNSFEHLRPTTTVKDQFFVVGMRSCWWDGVHALSATENNHDP